jgi:hypothetical protein
MKTLNELVLAASDAELHIKVDSDRLNSVVRRRDEGLYHIPLVSICALIVAKNKADGLLTADIAVWVGATLARHSRKARISIAGMNGPSSTGEDALTPLFFWRTWA